MILKLASFAARALPMPLKRLLYRLGPLSRGLRGALNRAAPSGLSDVPVAAGGLAGLTMRLDLQTEKDFWLGTYEPELQDAVRELVQPGMTIYDVGANIGYVSLLLARAVGEAGRVFAFEALPDNIERLRSNLDLNPGLTSRVEVVPRAVTGAPGPVRFLVHDSVGMGKVEGSAGRAEAYSGSIQVAGVSLDEYVYAEGNPLPDLLKVDIEGGEVLALPGMRRLLTEAHPILLMELHGPESARAAWETLTPLGYRLADMAAGHAPVESLDALGWKAYLIAR